jgi:hypothetical protein
MKVLGLRIFRSNTYIDLFVLAEDRDRWRAIVDT